MKYLIYTAYTFVVIAAVSYMLFHQYASHLMIVGCAILFISHFAERYEGKNIRLKRLYFIRHVIGVLYGLSAYFMFQQSNNWIVFLFLSAILEIYTISVINKESSK